VKFFVRLILSKLKKGNIYKSCVTSWKIASSIPDGVTGIFHWH